MPGPPPSQALPAADPVGRVITWLNTHPAVLAALGDGDRVDLYNEPPYPRVRVLDVTDNDRNMRWLVSTDLQFEVFGDLDGTPGKAALRRIWKTVIGAVAEIPDTEPGPGDPVITSVTGGAGGGWAPEPTGQPRYVTVLQIHSHPPAP